MKKHRSAKRCMHGHAVARYGFHEGFGKKQWRCRACVRAANRRWRAENPTHCRACGGVKVLEATHCRECWRSGDVLEVGRGRGHKVIPRG